VVFETVRTNLLHAIRLRCWHYRPGEALPNVSPGIWIMLCWRGHTLLLSRLSHPIRVRPVTLRGVAFMSTIPPAPAFKPFNLALIQLGQIGADKRANLNHARDMIRRAASGEGVGGAQGKPDLIVLPVSHSPSPCICCPHHTE
jgi:hypothetical protein